jgi:DNA-binding SARP family transcriptional activator
VAGAPAGPGGGDGAGLRVQPPARARTGPPARGAGTVLVTASRGYQLAVEPGSVDAQEVARLAGQGRATLDGDDPEQAAAVLRRALELWQGPALADVPDAPFARAEAARLDELRLGAVDDRIDADLALGRHSALVAELELQVLRHPMRERLRA